MRLFILTLLITLGVMLLFVWFFSLCRRKLRGTRHGLSGMCRKTGGSVCAACRKTTAKGGPAPERTAGQAEQHVTAEDDAEA